MGEPTLWFHLSALRSHLSWVSSCRHAAFTRLSSHIFSTLHSPQGQDNSQWARNDKARQNSIQAEVVIPVLAHVLCRLISVRQAREQKTTSFLLCFWELHFNDILATSCTLNVTQAQVQKADRHSWRYTRVTMLTTEGEVMSPVLNQHQNLREATQQYSKQMLGPWCFSYIGNEVILLSSCFQHRPLSQSRSRRSVKGTPSFRAKADRMVL